MNKTKWNRQIDTRSSLRKKNEEKLRFRPGSHLACNQIFFHLMYQTFFFYFIAGLSTTIETFSSSLVSKDKFWGRRGWREKKKRFS